MPESFFSNNFAHINLIGSNEFKGLPIKRNKAGVNTIMSGTMTQSWSEGGIQLLGKTLPEENFAQVQLLKGSEIADKCIDHGLGRAVLLN